MSGYVIRLQDGRYVSRPGSEHSYTKRLEDARRFRTADEARQELCPGNESVVAVDDVLAPAEPPSPRVVLPPR